MYRNQDQYFCCTKLLFYYVLDFNIGCMALPPKAVVLVGATLRPNDVLVYKRGGLLAIVVVFIAKALVVDLVLIGAMVRPSLDRFLVLFKGKILVLLSEGFIVVFI